MTPEPVHTPTWVTNGILDHRGRNPTALSAPLGAGARARLGAGDRVGDGDEVTITRHGRPVAVVIRPDALRSRRAEPSLRRADEIAALLHRYGAPVHEVGNFGQNALQLACHKRNIAMVRLLLEYGASPAVYPNPPSPLEQAAYKGEDELVALLLHHGGEPQEVWERGAIFRIPAPVLRLLVANSEAPPEDAIAILNAEGWE